MSEEKQDQGNLDDKTPETTVEIPEKFKNADGTTNTDAMAASYAELEKDRSRRVSEIDALKKASEQAAETAKISDALEAIKTNTTPKEEEKPSYDQYISDLTAKTAEELGLDADDPTVKLTVRVASEQAKALNSWNQADNEAMKAEHAKQINELRSMITTDQDSRVKSSSEYVANKAEIDEMVGAGIDENKAIAFVLKKAANTSDVSDPPPSMPSGRVAGGQVEDDYWKNEEEREQFVKVKGEPAVIAMETAGRARLKAAGGQ